MLQKVAMLQPWGTHHTCAWELPGLCLKGGLVRLFVRQAFFHILTHVSGCSGIFQKHVTYLCAIFILDADHEISKNHQCISKWIIEKSAEHQVCRFGRLSDSLKKESKKWETSAEYPVNPTTATHWKPRRVRNFKIQVSDLWNLTGLQRHEDWPFILRSPPPPQKKDLNWEGFSTQQHRLHPDKRISKYEFHVVYPNQNESRLFLNIMETFFKECKPCMWSQQHYKFEICWRYVVRRLAIVPKGGRRPASTPKERFRINIRWTGSESDSVLQAKKIEERWIAQ